MTILSGGSGGVGIEIGRTQWVPWRSLKTEEALSRLSIFVLMSKTESPTILSLPCNFSVLLPSNISGLRK
ncbi:hypothetical protein A2U01_0075425, partial [Trifolium medium]|nr:hypothetical protein [Trifolium medium]